jgi:hypothetical protein
LAYYFLVAQLPYLSPQMSKPPFSSLSFRERCAEYLTKKEIALFDACVAGFEEKKTVGSPGGSSFLSAWKQREEALEYALARLRAGRQKREFMTEGFYVTPDIENQARTAFGMDNPLEAELFLDKGRWDALEGLLGRDYFGINVVYAYYIKLLLLERKASFQADEGFEEYKTRYDEILKKAPEQGAAGDSK